MKPRVQFDGLRRCFGLTLLAFLAATSSAQAAGPNIFGDGASESIFDTATNFRPFRNLRITGADDVVVTITFAAVEGMFPVSSQFTKSGNIYTLNTNDTAAATAFLTNLVFTPVKDRIDIGTTETFDFRIVATDTNGLSSDGTNTLEIVPVNDAPNILNAGASLSLGDNQTNRPFSSVRITDADNRGTQTLTLTIAIDLPTHGNFTNNTLAPFTSLGGGQYRVSGTPASVTMALTNLQFKPRENFLPVGSTEATTFSLSVRDDAVPSLSDNGMNTLTVTSINDLPQVGGVPVAAQAIRTGSSGQPFATVLVTDADVGATGPPSQQSQSLQVTLIGTNVVGQVNPPGGSATTFTLAGVTASEATLALEGLTYVAPTFPLPQGVTNRMRASITVTDSSGGIRVNTNTIIDLYSVFTPPGLTGTRADQRVNDIDTIAPFSTVSIQSLNGGSFAVRVNLDNDAKGQLINLAGFVKTPGAPALYTFTGTSEAATIAIRQLLFQPTPNRLNGSATETVVCSITLVDGGTVSGPDQTTTVIVSPVNDRPVIQGIPPLIRITDDQTTQPFQTVKIIDVDENGTQAVRLTITLDNPAKGSFDTNRLDGFVPSGAGLVLTAPPAAVTLAMSNLLFAPTQNRVPIGQAETTTFTIGADDQHGGTAVNSATSVRVSSVAGAPEITVPQPQPISRPLDPPPQPFESVLITDEEELTVTVAILNTNKGTFMSNTLASTGFTNSGPGRFTFHGTPEAVSNAITHLVFSPNTNVPPGLVDFSITVVDATGNTVTAAHSMLLRATQKTFIVTQTGDYDPGETDPSKILGTLRKAVEDAGNNDHITFCPHPPAPGLPNLPATIRLRRLLALNKNVTFDGPGASQLAVSGDRDNNGAATVPLFEVNATARFNRLTLTKGSSGFAGGAVSVRPTGHLLLSYCAITECEAEQWGGAIDVDGGSLSVDHCLIASNHTSAAVGQGGGAISLYTVQECSIENTTFSGNRQRSAGGLGGGALYVENKDPGTPFLVHVTSCTFHGNSDAANGGTSIRPNVFNAQVFLKNTIVADGQGRNLDTDQSGLITSLGGNVSDDSTRTIFSFGGAPYEVVILEPPADQNSVPALLASLAFNFGPTLNHALPTNSPALNLATHHLGTDQRGFWRDGPADSGAFELGAGKQIVINEIQFDPLPNTNDEFIEFYVPRNSSTQNLEGFSVCIGGVPRHTFTSQVLGPGQALVLFSTNATSTLVPAGVFKQVAAGNLMLDNNADTITVKDPQGRLVFEVDYVGSYTASDPAETNLLQGHQSITLVPEFTGVFIPHQRAYKKVIGADPGPAIVSSPGMDLSGASLAGGNKPPVAFDDYAITDEDTPLVIAVLNNDLELDGADQVRVVAGTSPTALDAQVTTDGTNIFYNPSNSPTLRSLPPGSNRVDTFTYTIIDCCNPATGLNWPATGTKYTATNYVTVLGVNDAPTPQPDSGATNPLLRTREDLLLEINVASNVLANDSDPDAGETAALRIASVHPTSVPENTVGALSSLGALVTLEIRFNPNETRIFYDPGVSDILNALSQGETATDTFYYSVVDEHGASGVGQVTILVTGTNDTPTATADLLATDEDTLLAVPVISILSNDSDPDTDDNMTTVATLQITALNGATSLVTTSALGARVSFVGTNIVFDPTFSLILNALARKEVVVDSFTYTASDGFGGTSTATVSVAVIGVNDRPMTAPDIASTTEDTLKVVPAPGVRANDFDFDVNGSSPDDVLRAIPVLTSHTALGAAYRVNGDGSFTYDPRGVFDYLKQGWSLNDLFTYVVVDDSYTIANDDQFSVLTDSTNVTLPVLANDVSLTGTGGSLRVTAVGASDNGGTAFIAASGTALVYTPAVSFVGVESFQYSVEDGQGGHDTATVRVTATLPLLNGRLTVNADRFTVARGTTATLDVLGNDNVLPAAGDALRILAPVSTDQGGMASLSSMGLNNALVYTPTAAPALSYPYTETLTYSVSGGGIARATGTVIVTVINRQGVLPVNDDVFTVLVDTGNNPLDVLANDRVVPGTTTNLTITAIYTNGVSGIVTTNAAGNRLLYTPPAGSPSHVEPAIHYAISDGSGGTATGAVMITVIQSGLNANADFCTVARSSTNALLVLANDNALPNLGQNLLITTMGLGTNAPNRGGSATVSPTGKSIIYSPSPTNLTGEETFVYEITDGTLARAQGRVKVKILDRQGAVNVNADDFSVARDSTNNILRVLLNDNIQPDTRERLTITALGAASRGGIVRLGGSVPNQFVFYDPPRGFVGDETLTYAVTDNRGGTAIATVRVRVGYVAARDDLLTVPSDTASNALDVLANDRLLPNVTLGRPLWALGPADHGGSVQLSAARDAVLYTPAPGFIGRETFTYQVADDTTNLVMASATVQVLRNGADRDTNTVTMTIIGVNDPPVISGPTIGGPITDKQTSLPFAGITIADVDEFGDEMQTVRVIMDPQQGVLTNIDGFVPGPPGTYRLTGVTPANATVALRAMVFVPTENRIIVPTTENIVFTILANDGIVTVTNTITQPVQAVNDPPLIAGTVAGLRVYHRSTMKPFYATLITEVDDSTLQPLEVRVTMDATHGFFTRLSGFVSNAPGVYVLNNATAATATLALRALTFVPTTGNRVSTGVSETTRFTISVNDGFASAVLDTNTTVTAIAGLAARLQQAVQGNSDADDEYGGAVAATRDFVATGQRKDDNNHHAGTVYIYARQLDGSETWNEIKTLMPPGGGNNDDFFGTSVAMSGDFLVVGAPGDDDRGSDAGAAYIYSRNQDGANQWGFVQKITAADGANGDSFGTAVTIDGDTIAVGAHRDDDRGSESGSVYVFTRSGPSWVQVTKVTAPDGAARDEFGFRVALGDDTLVVGAHDRDQSGSDSGAAYVFSRHQGGANQWGLVKKLLPTDPGQGDQFGYAVSVEKDTVVVGAPFNDDLGSDSGSAYVFMQNQGGSNQWGQVKKLLPVDGSSSDNFGQAVGIDGDNIVVGAPHDNGNGSDSGSAYLFTRNAGGLNQWGQTEKFIPGANAAGGNFGAGLAVNENTLGLGAPFDDPGSGKFGSLYIYRLKYENGPMVVTPVPDLATPPNVPFTFVLPANTFGDPDVPDMLLLTTGPLPAWLTFSPLTATFSGTPAVADDGTNVIAVTATDQDGQSASLTFRIVVSDPVPPVLSPREQWRALHFDAHVLNPGEQATLWGDTADPDHDGLFNLFEYVAGTDPLQANAAADVLRIRAADSPGEVFVEFQRRIGLPDYSFAIESSVELMPWIPSTVVVLEELTVPLSATVERVTLRIPTGDPPEAHQFFRLKLQE